VTVLSPLVEILHDVSVVNVTVAPSVVKVGEEVVVTVVVKNEGTEIESFNVTAYFDDHDQVISTFLVSSLASEDETGILFVWNTSGVAPGVYTVSARAASVPNEINVEDNVLTDGVVKVTSDFLPPIIPYWLIDLLLFIIILLIMFLVIVFLYRRKKQKDSRESFIKAWKAWYTCSPINYNPCTLHTSKKPTSLCT